MSLEQFHWAMIPYGIPFSKRFRLYSAALFSNCKLQNTEKIIIILVVTTISIKSVSFCSFLPNAKELGREISEWWSEKYDNSYGTKIAIPLKKKKKRKDQAPLIVWNTCLIIKNEIFIQVPQIDLVSSDIFNTDLLWASHPRNATCFGGVELLLSSTDIDWHDVQLHKWHVWAASWPDGSLRKDAATTVMDLVHFDFNCFSLSFAVGIIFRISYFR